MHYGDSGVRVLYATPGKVEESAKAIAKIDGVKSAHACWGRPDVIAFVEAPNPKVLGQLVLQKVQRAPGVEATGSVRSRHPWTRGVR